MRRDRWYHFLLHISFCLSHPHLYKHMNTHEHTQPLNSPDTFNCWAPKVERISKEEIRIKGLVGQISRLDKTQGQFQHCITHTHTHAEGHKVYTKGKPPQAKNPYFNMLLQNSFTTVTRLDSQTCRGSSASQPSENTQAIKSHTCISVNHTALNTAPVKPYQVHVGVVIRS